MSDVVVVGGGVIGLGVAWRARLAGLSVTLVDPAPGAGASWAAAGMLAPVTEVHYGEEALLALNLASAARYPSFVAELEERVSLLETLKRKYGATVADVIAFGDDAAARLRKIESRGEELARLERESEAVRAALTDIGAKLTKKRAAASPKLAKDIQSQLHDLGFKKSEFSITRHSSPKPMATGYSCPT